MDLVFIDENGKKIYYEFDPLADRFYMIENSLYLEHSIEDDLSESVLIPGDYEENSDQTANENMLALHGQHSHCLIKINYEDTSNNQFDGLRDFMNRYGRDADEDDGDHIRVETNLDGIRIADVRGDDAVWAEIVSPTLTRTAYATSTGTVFMGDTTTTFAGWRI